VDTALRDLSVSNASSVAALAELPDMVRGYGKIKLANVARFRKQLAAPRA
jgi:hypothetical protein